MQDANFKDPITKEEFFIQKYRSVYRGGKWININPDNGNELINESTGNVLEIIEKEGAPAFLKGNNKAELQKMLKKRSSIHYKKEIEEVKYEKMKKLRGYNKKP